MLSLEFGGAKKEAPEARKQEFVLSHEFVAAKCQFWGPREAEKSTFNTCLSRIYKRPTNFKTRGGGGNRNWFCPPHLARGTSIIESKNHSIQESKDTWTQLHHIKVSTYHKS